MKAHSPCFEAASIMEMRGLLLPSPVAPPSDSNALNLNETPRKTSQRQAYVAMKASPSVSADGDASARVSMKFIDDVFLFSCRRNPNVSLNSAHTVLQRL
jgi:hypothetical protein